MAQTFRVIVFFATLLSVLDSVGNEAAFFHVSEMLTNLHAQGVNVGRILALSGLGGLAFGWFGRDILSNIIGGLMVYLTQPFAQVGPTQSPDLDMLNFPFLWTGRLGAVNRRHY